MDGIVNFLNSMVQFRWRTGWLVFLGGFGIAIAISIGLGSIDRNAPTPPPPPQAIFQVATLTQEREIIDVTRPPYNARGDGRTDNTAAIQAAISENRGKLIYFPNGTYLVRDSLYARSEDGKQKRFFLQGQNQQETVIRLIDRAPGFQDRSTPKPLLSFWEGRVGDATAFRNTVSHLTLNVGRNNPGAIALRFRANNFGSVHHVTLRSIDRKGRYGLDLSPPLNGPLLISHLTVSGFDIGVYFVGALHSATLSHINLNDQTEYGIYNRRQVLNLEDLTSHNRVPALYNDSDGGRGYGLVTLVNATLNGGSANVTALENPGGGGLYVRNLTSQGYRHAISNTVDNRTITRDSPVREFVSHNVLTLFSNPETALNLPIEPTPEATWDDPDDTVTVAPPGEDATAALQAAIDSGKSTLYLPRANYTISDTVEIRGNVRRIVGLGAAIVTASDRLQTTDRPVFRLVEGTADTVSLEGIEAHLGSSYFIEHAAPRTLVLKHLGAGGYRNLASGSKLFLEDVVGDRFDFQNQQVWARQFNVEAGRHSGKFNIRNNGADVWILGLKTERDVTLIETIEGGRTELLGAFLYGNRDIPENTPAFLDRESRQSLVFLSYNHPFQPYIREIHRGETRDLSPEALYPVKYGKMSPLFVGSTP
ncbi:MAG: hypothetical protein J7641_14040 [Cyanobacteria bacterium SID2]|nr:hypothetical protein [Cyanobacteria bacterium SID2]